MLLITVLIVLLLLVVSVGSIYLIFRLCKFTLGGSPFVVTNKEQVPPLLMFFFLEVELENQEHTVSAIDTPNEGSAPTGKPASQVPPRASHPCAVTSHY